MLWRLPSSSVNREAEADSGGSAPTARGGSGLRNGRRLQKEEQERAAAKFVGVVPTEFEVGSYVLVKYPSRPPSKLHCRWSGPFEVMSRDRNNVLVRDLTSDVRHEYDATRLRPFLLSVESDPKQLAAADLGELEVSTVLDHRGSAKKRAELEFLVKWSDGDETWEPWEHVKKLAVIDEYVRAHPDAKLKSLLAPQKK